MDRTFRLCSIIVFLMTVLVSGPALAHETREVGAYRFVVGFVNEPPLVEEPNGVDLRVTRIADNTPVEGLEKTLRVSLSYAGGKETDPQPLRPRFGMPGRYTLDVVPTKAGEYTFHFTGEIEGRRVDERFTSGPGRFDHVGEKTAMMFPERQPLIGDLASTARTARLIGVAGLIVGVLGMGLGVTALTIALRGGRRHAGDVSLPSL